MVDYGKYYSSLANNIRASDIRELLALIKHRRDVISFAGGIPDPKLFPKSELADISREAILKYGDEALQYSETKGLIELRETLSDFMRRMKGISADPEDIVVTTGSQQALDIVARSMIDPGDIVVTENPSYLAAIGAFKAAGARLVGVEMDDNGMDTFKLEEKLKSIYSTGGRVKFIYTIPVGHNPAGTTLSYDRRKHLLEIAEKYDVLVVEDDPYSYITYENGVDTTPLKALDRYDRVIYLSTMSKILAPGLRIGWIVAPREVARKFELVKQYLDLHSPTLTQFIVLEAIKKGLVERMIKVATPYYKSKRDAMLSAMEDYFPDYVSYTRPIGGLFIFARVEKEGFNTTKLLEVAINKYKVAYVPGAGFFVDGSGYNTMRINFSYPTHDEIYEGVRRLAQLVKSE
ncbi:PLP-dependent aminotransferase family protein [Thermogladius sp. 4427co]|uniref:aminotransferase-like domain-containing protein n=1 Tax=Thermogladius sp. 4427co TaxID=3450718 RepID=UPI003F79C0FB